MEEGKNEPRGKICGGVLGCKLLVGWEIKKLKIFC
jgi:hypothetical protein